MEQRPVLICFFIVLVNAVLLPAGFVIIADARVTREWWICTGCGYDLRGSFGRSSACPECGLAIPEHPEKVGQSARYERPGLILGLTLLAVPVLLDAAYVTLIVFTSLSGP